MKRAFIASIMIFGLAGCSSVVMLDASTASMPSSCQVRVWASKESAAQEGKIKEVCLITGTSSMSFSHTVGTAIEKNKSKACECGATDVYVQAQDAGTLGTASVTLVAFRFVK